MHKDGKAWGKVIDQSCQDPLNHKHRYIRGRMVAKLKKLNFLRYGYFPDSHVGAIGHAETIWASWGPTVYTVPGEYKKDFKAIAGYLSKHPYVSLSLVGRDPKCLAPALRILSLKTVDGAGGPISPLHHAVALMK